MSSGTAIHFGIDASETDGLKKPHTREAAGRGTGASFGRVEAKEQARDLMGLTFVRNGWILHHQKMDPSGEAPWHGRKPQAGTLYSETRVQQTGALAVANSPSAPGPSSGAEVG